MELWEQIAAIEAQMAQQIIDAAITGVNGVLLEREYKSGSTHPPYVIVYLDPSPVSDKTTAIGEQWTIRWTVQAVAAPYEDNDGDQHRKIALQARTAIISDRSLASTADDTVCTGWEPASTRGPASADSQLFAASVSFETTILNYLA